MLSLLSPEQFPEKETNMTVKKTQLIIVAASICTISLSSLFFGVLLGMSHLEPGHSDIPTSSPPAPVNKDRPHPISKARVRGDRSSKQRPSAQRIEKDQNEPKRFVRPGGSSSKLTKAGRPSLKREAAPNVSGGRESKIPFFFVQSVP